MALYRHVRDGPWSGGGLRGREVIYVCSMPIAPERLMLTVVNTVISQLAFRLWDTSAKMCTDHTSFRISLSYIWNQKGPLLRNRRG